MGMVVASAILLPLFSFFDLLDQLDDVGKGSYAIRDAFLYTVMLLPRRFIQIAPFIALLGTVGALGALAVNLELVAMRVAGLSPFAISLPPVGVGLLLIILIAGLEYFVAPQFQQKAIALRAAALEQSAELGRGLGIWTRDAQNILRIGEMLHENQAVDIEIMHFNQQGLLTAHAYAQYADIMEEGVWILRGVIVRTFAPSSITARHASRMSWQSFLGPEDIATLTKPPESLTPSELVRHAAFLEETGQQADAYRMALWRKIGGAIMTAAMILIAVPFIFGSVREGLGSKLVVAALMGIGIYLLDQIIANVGLLLQLNPIMVSITPGLILVVIAAYWLLRRVS
ncbi:lipopolysaccharide export system permease protein [Nitrosomonas halophila]|uniref:Lipopolysaccharide export system permease protein n=2 Tax=Nitrosomonas halophila TaxID=44576 RepID=A0A1H3MBW7_9PROT|nr:lipopolysaccharide export system permease protein [Nitrosomonas halophila]